MPKQDVAVEIFVNGVWTDLVGNDEVLADQTITITRGDTAESAAPRPSSITLSLNNYHDMFRTSNPMSPLYGKAGVNTPLRVAVAGVVRGIGEVSYWGCDQSREFRKTPRRGKAWTDVEANGITYRINQWTLPVESTMTKGIRSFGSALIGGWPLEDPTETTVLANVVIGGFLGKFSGSVGFGDSERPAGSGSSTRLSTAGRIYGTFIKASSSGWQISFAMKLPAAPTSGTYEEIFAWTDSIGRRWSWQVNNVAYGWEVYASDGTTLLSSLTASYVGTSSGPTQWIRFRMKVSISAGTITWEPGWYIEGDDSLIGTSSTFAATSTGYLRNWEAKTATYNDGGWYTGVAGLNNATTEFFNAGVLADFNGHVGETPGDRFERLMNDFGLLYAVNGTNSLSVIMGAQPVAPLSDILKEIRDTEDAVLFDAKSTISLVLTLRNFRYNQTAVILDITDNPSGFPSLPREVTDDLPIHNIVTVSNREGGSVTVEDSTSIMGSQPPPDGRGEYRQNIEVSVADPDLQLDELAGYWLNKGTISLPRYPTVLIDLTNMNPSKITEVETITIGTVLEIQNYREYTIRLNVIGYTETIGTHRRFISYICSPDQQYVVSTYDSTNFRYDLRTCTLNGDHAVSATTLNFTITDFGDAWSSTDDYELLISGEKVYIPVGAMAARSGSGPYAQVATGVVRAVNGISKILPSGSEVHVANPGRYA